MNRLVRIALTLFVSATILLLLARQRLVRLTEQSTEILPADYVRDETQMATIGMIIAGLLAVTGIVLVTVALVRRRKPTGRRDG